MFNRCFCLFAVSLMTWLGFAAAAPAQERPGLSLSKGWPTRGVFVAHGGGEFTGPELKLLLDEGGKDLIYIPTNADPLTEEARDLIRTRWTGRGFGSVTILQAESREQAMDPQFSKPLAGRKAVFISGGKQEFLQRYTGSPVADALRQIIDNGGVAMGTSAGMAMIGSRALIKSEQASDGSQTFVEDQGWNFCPCIFDQHFLKKEREWRLKQMCERYPGLPGLGVDEKTACVIRFTPEGAEISVLGESEVWYYSRESEKHPLALRQVRSGDPALKLAFRR